MKDFIMAHRSDAKILHSFSKQAQAFCLLWLMSICLITAPAFSAETPLPAQQEPILTNTQNIVLAGGCFWGMEAVFEHIRGVKDVISGYSGGTETDATYSKVSSGTTGHAESVSVTFDSSKISLEQLLQVFFTVAHDPTQLNAQGPDHGPQYKSAIFYSSPGQAEVAQKVIQELASDHKFSDPIVTKLIPLTKFYPAEAYHQDFARKNPFNPYILVNDAPKVTRLEKAFPDLFVEK